MSDQVDKLQKQSTIREIDYEGRSAEDLLRALVNYNGSNLKIPNDSWYRQYFKLLGKDMVLAEGFGPMGDPGWVEKAYFEKCLEDDRIDTEERDVLATTNHNNEPDHSQ